MIKLVESMNKSTPIGYFFTLGCPLTLALAWLTISHGETMPYSIRPLFHHVSCMTSRRVNPSGSFWCVENNHNFPLRTEL